jgi:hypothetical protein
MRWFPTLHCTIARSEQRGGFIGEELLPAQWHRVGPGGVFEFIDSKGQPPLGAHAWSELTGWQTAVWAPKALAPPYLVRRWGRRFFRQGAPVLCRGIQSNGTGDSAGPLFPFPKNAEEDRSPRAAPSRLGPHAEHTTRGDRTFRGQKSIRNEYARVL